MKKTSSPGNGPWYSSNQIQPVQIEAENKQGSVTPADRQIFEVELKANGSTQRGLVIRGSNPPRLALLTTNVDRKYAPRAGEVELPMTPRLNKMLEQVSKSRRGLTQADRNSYQDFDQAHQAQQRDPRAVMLPAALARPQSNVAHVKYGGIRAVSVPAGSEWKLGTTGVANCMACGLRTPSTTQRGHIVIVLAHYSGSDPDTGEPMSPRELLDKMIAMARAQGGWVGQGLEIMLAGGERARGGSGANRLGEEEEFLELKDRYPIVAAKVQATSVDVNSDKQTIHRHTDDDHSSSINVVMSARGLLCSRGTLYDEDAARHLQHSAAPLAARDSKAH